jgi:hypothetical protein
MVRRGRADVDTGVPPAPAATLDPVPGAGVGLVACDVVDFVAGDAGDEPRHIGQQTRVSAPQRTWKLDFGERGRHPNPKATHWQTGSTRGTGTLEHQ